MQTVGVQLGSQRFGLLATDIGDGDPGTVLTQCSAQCFSQTLGASRDQCHLIV
jgi:hypothetical protein